MFDSVLHSSLDDLIFITKQRLVQGGVVRREVLSKLQNTELMKLIDVDHKSLSFDRECSAKDSEAVTDVFKAVMTEFERERGYGPSGDDQYGR